MITEPDVVLLTAHMLIDRHGEHAPHFALASVDLLIERGDLARAAQWGRVSVAAAEVLAERAAAPAPGGARS